MYGNNLYKKILAFFMSFILIFSNISFESHANASAAIPYVKAFFEGLAWTAAWEAGANVAESAVDKVKSWFSGDKPYYNIATEHGGGGHTDTDRSKPKYYDNNEKLSSAMNNYYNNVDNSSTDNSITNNQQFIDNSTTSQYTYTTFDTTVSDNRNFSLVKDSYNTTNNTYETMIYNPVTNNYTTVNNITYNNQYDTYNITNNEYNYYVTNNYTYVSYYIINNETNEETYHEVYYEMPDGRNTYDLEKEDVWGEYFIYDIANYELVAEDDGTTLALYHLDGNLKDSSYWVNNDMSGGSGVYNSAKFGNGYYVNSDTFFNCSDKFDINNFTLEFVVNFTVNSSYISKVCLRFTYNSEYYYFYTERGSGIYYIVIQCDNGNLTGYVNGVKTSIFSYTPTTLYNIPEFLCLYKNRIYFDVMGNKYVKSRDEYGLEDYGVVSVNYTLDEVRLSNKVIYPNGVSSVPSQPFDTNMVLTVPQNPKEDMIAIRGNYDVANCRIGGVRPTYPTQGDVYIYLEDDIVKDIQQYEGDAWYSVVGAIYQDDEWHDLKEFDMSTYTFEVEEMPDDDSGGGSDDSTGDNSSGGSVSGNGTGNSGSGISDLLDGIGKIFDTILSLIGKIMVVVADFSQSVLDLFSGFTTFTDGFNSFLTDAFGFIPKEIIDVITVGISLAVILAVIRFLRG